MSDQFGDFTIDDAWDTADADPEALAHKFWTYRRDNLGHPSPPWEVLTPAQQWAVTVGVIAILKLLHDTAEQDALADGFQGGYRSVVAAPRYSELPEDQKSTLRLTVLELIDWLRRENLGYGQYLD